MAAGTTTSDEQPQAEQQPLVERDQSRWTAARARSGWKVVMSDTASSPCGSWKNMKATL